MGNFLSKFFMSFGSKKNKYLPAGSLDENIASNVDLSAMNSGASVNTIGKAIKPLATFDLNIEKPRYEGAIPEATIKFYPLD